MRRKHKTDNREENMANTPTSDELLIFFTQDSLVEKIVGWARAYDHDELEIIAGRYAELHNSGALDILRLVEHGVIQSLGGEDFFTVMPFFCHILPGLEVTPKQMMECVVALVARGGNDLMASEPNAAFRTWCSNEPSRAHEVISEACKGDDLSIQHLTFGLEAINAISEARQIAITYEDDRRFSAILALSRMEDVSPTSISETISTFGTILNSGADDKLRSALLDATVAILARSPSNTTPESTTLISKLTADAGDLTVHQAARALWVLRNNLQPEIVGDLLKALARINPGNKGTIEALDLGLKSLLKHGQAEAAIRYVTQLLSSEDINLELKELGGFTRDLFSGPPDFVSSVIVKWLMIGAPRLCGGLSDALRSRSMDGPVIDLNPQDLTIPPAAQVFICKKAIGWFFVKSTTAASILVSVLRVCDSETANAVQKLLIEDVLLNYNGVREYLEGISPEDPAKNRVAQSLAANDAYLESLRDIPSLKELQPSEHHRRIQRLRMTDQMREIQKQTYSQSIFLSLARRSVMLYGNRSLSFVKESNDVLRPMEMDLKPFSVSYEMPRLERIDPIGLDYTLRVYRTEQMES